MRISLKEKVFEAVNRGEYDDAAKLIAYKAKSPEKIEELVVFALKCLEKGILGPCSTVDI